jgi:hypothetical protein
MGREVRRVPMNWQHPKKANGRYQPLHDQTYEDRMKEWNADKAAFESDPVKVAKYTTFAEYETGIKGMSEQEALPDPASYRPAWDENAVLGYCYYENISEGTPISPVLATPEELVNWLVENEGIRREAAERFVEIGWSLSMVAGPGINGLQRMIDVMDIVSPKIDDGA